MWKQVQLWEPKSMCDQLLHTWEMMSCIACVLGRWDPAFLAYCCLTARGRGLDSPLQAPSWKDLPTWFSRGFTDPPLWIHLHVYSLMCCSHSEFGSVLRDHRVHLRWKRWEEVSFLWDLCVRQKGDGSTGRAGRGARGAGVKYVSSSFLLQPTDFLVQFQGTSKWVFTSQM